MLKVACLLLANVTLASAVLHIHNPSNASVKEVHVVFSWHFDGGCKTPGCGALLNGEPDLCAKVGAGNAHGATDPFGTGEPFNCNPAEPGGTYGGTAAPFVMNDILNPTGMPPGSYTLTYTVNGFMSELCEFIVVRPTKSANAGSLNN